MDACSLFHSNVAFIRIMLKNNRDDLVFDEIFPIPNFYN